MAAMRLGQRVLMRSSLRKGKSTPASSKPGDALCIDVGKASCRCDATKCFETWSLNTPISPPRSIGSAARLSASRSDSYMSGSATCVGCFLGVAQGEV